MENITIAGRIGREPESRYTPTGKATLTFSMSLYTGGNKESGYKDSVWVRVIAWDDLAEKWIDKIHKGEPVTITGRVDAPRTWVDKGGETRSAGLEITANRIVIGDEFKAVDTAIPTDESY